ncbi:PQQ-binding-like beta-propeller repeat protein, partial [Streptomyces diacarni]|uniref:outer membrane protein assembly factor BamB family protein n=1 Tax=Streptomyces diacarni TaxID=2800381 RepID=UPI0033D9A64F
RRPAGRPPVPRGARRRRVVRAAGGAGLAVVVSAALACGVWWTWRGGDDRPPGDDVGRAGPPAPSSSPVTDPGAPGGDRELPAPSSRVRDVSLAAGAWTTTWDNLTPEPEAGEDVNAVRGSDLLGAWLTEDAVVRANEHDVRAYDRRTGRALWKATPPRHGLVPCAMSRTAEHGIGAVAFGRSHRPDEGCDQLAAIRLDDGQTVWRTGLRPEKREVDRVRTTVGIARGRVVVHSFSGLVAYDLGDGRAVWRRSWRHDGCGLSSVRAARAVVAVVSSCREGKKGSDEAARTRVSQLNADDGTVRWSTKLTEKATGASINTVRPLSVRLYLRDSDALPLQVFGPDGTAQPPLENEQPFGTLKTSAGLPSRPEIFGWKDTVVTTYYTRSDEARFGVAAIDTRTGKVRWHRPALDGVPELYGVDGDGALAVDERDGALGGTQLLRMDLSDGDVRTGGTLPTRDTGPVGTLLARKDTVLLFPSLDTAEGVAVLAAPGT